jgi:tetratricopeptide (TPR) repeat protein
MKMKSTCYGLVGATLLVASVAAPAWAQSSNAMPAEVGQNERQNSADRTAAQDQIERRREHTDGYQSMREMHEAALAKQRGERAAEKEKAAAQYPQATRTEPETTATKAGLKKLQEVQKLYEAQDYANTIAKANAIAADASSNAYEKAFAYQLAGSAAAADGDDATAAQAFEKALAANGLDNNNQYTVMYNLAVTQYGLGQNDKALQTLDRFLAETKSDKPEAQNLRGGILVALERYGEAGKLYGQLLAAHPDDKNIRMNAVAAYQQADQPDKAMALLADAQAKGQLTQASEYRALYVSYINADKDKDALAVIEDGIAKGALKPSPELARDYMVLGQRAYAASDLATAIQMYAKAAPMAADGEAALNLAKIYAEAGKPAEAKAAAQQALDKGVKDAAAARKLLGGG